MRYCVLSWDGRTLIPKVDEGESGNMVRAWTTDKCTRGRKETGGLAVEGHLR